MVLIHNRRTQNWLLNRFIPSRTIVIVLLASESSSQIIYIVLLASKSSSQTHVQSKGKQFNFSECNSNNFYSDTNWQVTTCREFNLSADRCDAIIPVCVSLASQLVSPGCLYGTAAPGSDCRISQSAFLLLLRWLCELKLNFVLHTWHEKRATLKTKRLYTLLGIV